MSGLATGGQASTSPKRRTVAARPIVADRANGGSAHNACAGHETIKDAGNACVSTSDMYPRCDIDYLRVCMCEGGGS